MKKIIIIIICLFLSILDQLFLRTLFNGYSSFLDVFLGSFPSFLFVVGFSYLLIICFSKYTKMSSQESIKSSILGALIGAVTREFIGSNTQWFGGTFDYYDIVFCFLGAIFVYFLEKERL